MYNYSSENGDVGCGGDVMVHNPVNFIKRFIKTNDIYIKLLLVEDVSSDR